MACSSRFVLFLSLAAGLMLTVTGCSSENQVTVKPEAMDGSTPATLDRGLVLSLAQFAKGGPSGGGAPRPLPATLEFLMRKDGKWLVSSIEDKASNVFHKAMEYETVEGEKVLLSAAGSAASLKLWRKGADGKITSETIWEKDFGGKFSRMRDVEVADIYGDGKNTMVVATHDEGVVAVVRPNDAGGYYVEEIDHGPRTFVHEIEIGDLDGDGVLEVYATPSEPNRLEGKSQSGTVVRYVPKKNEGRTVVADLGDRHAKEILVEDVDGDGRDELYVVVEGVIDKHTGLLAEPVEIRRYEADSDPTTSVVVAFMDDHLGRFLTVGDLDGDGKKEMVAALFNSGLWLLRPGSDPNAEWIKESIDTDSGGFEHASIITDLDGDGIGELYVASDNDSEIRRYVWKDGAFKREAIYHRDNGNIFTWSIMPLAADLFP